MHIAVIINSTCVPQIIIELPGDLAVLQLGIYSKEITSTYWEDIYVSVLVMLVPTNEIILEVHQRMSR